MAFPVVGLHEDGLPKQEREIPGMVAVKHGLGKRGGLAEVLYRV